MSDGGTGSSGPLRQLATIRSRGRPKPVPCTTARQEGWGEGALLRWVRGAVQQGRLTLLHLTTWRRNNNVGREAAMLTLLQLVLWRSGGGGGMILLQILMPPPACSNQCDSARGEESS